GWTIYPTLRNGFSLLFRRIEDVTIWFQSRMVHPFWFPNFIGSINPSPFKMLLFFLLRFHGCLPKFPVIQHSGIRLVNVAFSHSADCRGQVLRSNGCCAIVCVKREGSLRH